MSENVTPRLAEVMSALEARGSEQTRRIFANHGCKGPQFGVKVGDLKLIIKDFKDLKTNPALPLALWDTGNSDARYLAGLVADPKKLSRETLQHWVEGADWSMIAEYSVAWNAAESAHGWDLGRAWIDDPAGREMVQTAGWHTLSCLAALKPDDALDLPTWEALLRGVPDRIRAAPNRARVGMVGFVIATAGGIAPLLPAARDVAARLGKVEVDVGETNCKIPVATESIDKLVAGGHIGRKRKTVKC
jgi:3-methyladenine DNA glycosylase AlkD